MADHQPSPSASGPAAGSLHDLRRAAMFAVIATGLSAYFGYVWYEKPLDLRGLAIQFAVLFGGWYLMFRAGAVLFFSKKNKT